MGRSAPRDVRDPTGQLRTGSDRDYAVRTQSQCLHSARGGKTLDSCLRLVSVHCASSFAVGRYLTF